MATVTLGQLVLDTREYMDAVGSTRWSDATIKLVLNNVFDSEWSNILNAAPYYRFAIRQVTTDVNGQFAFTTLNSGSADTQQNFYRMLSVSDGNVLYGQTRYQDVPLATTSNYLPTYPRLYYIAGQAVQALPVSSALGLYVGVNYKLTPSLRVFANYSESYFVGQADAPATIAEKDFEPETAAGYDYGFKGSYFEDRLTFTVSGFYAVRNNVTVTDIEETPVGSGNYVQVQRRDGDQLVRGWEVDANWKVSEEIFTGMSYGNVNSIYTDFGTAFPLAVGRKVAGISPRNGSVYLKWSPARGALKNFSANLGVTHVAETPTEQPHAGDTYTTGPGGVRVLSRSTNQWSLTVPAATLLNLGLRYTIVQPKVSHTLAVNLNNLTDEDYLRANRLLSERRSVYFTYTLASGGKRR
jgi:outer membrane receptor protein involved in Fe transport